MINNEALPYIINVGVSATFYFDGKPITVNKDQANYATVMQALKDNDWVTVKKNLNLERTVINYMEGNVELRGNKVLYKDREIGNSVVNKILEFLENEIDVIPLLKFLNKLMENPSYNSIQQLYKFLEHGNMPITPEGNFLAYKAVSSEYLSISSGDNTVYVSNDNGETWLEQKGRIDNSVGNIVSVDRSQVDDNPKNHCSKGLHAGSHWYATDYGKHNSGIIIIVEINPKDVVSVPDDYDCQKARVCKYRVVGDCDGLIEKPYYNDNSIEDSDISDTLDDSVEDQSYDDGGDFYEEEFLENEVTEDLSNAVLNKVKEILENLSNKESISSKNSNNETKIYMNPRSNSSYFVLENIKNILQD